MSDAPAAAGGGRLRALWVRLSRSHVRAAAVAVAGASAGALYAHFVGCRTGTCPLTSSVWTASLYGGAVGALLGWPAARG
ncbi:MAG TPA: DUF6132 family protein [Anaeromyxobacteraceae bacterium]|nr:DUF6132 family protein [Anaeromyxobacteraceae bacterium]